MTYAQQSAWLRAKHLHDKAQPMGQFYMASGWLCLTISWPHQGGYPGYGQPIKQLRG